MKTLLTIGHQHFILPDSANVNVILKTLSSAKPVERRFVSTIRDDRFLIRPEPVEVSVRILHENQIQKPQKPKQISEEASPDAHNTF